MTFQEFCAILDAWPTSSQRPDEVILLDYKLEPFMAIVFCTNRFLETARLIFEESQRSGRVPWCWLDGTGKVIWQRLRILLLGGLTMNHTTALFSFSLAEKENTDALHFILECTSRAITTRYPGFTWSMGKFMSDGDPAMYNAAKRVWVAIVWLLCYWHAQRAMLKALKKVIPDRSTREEVHAAIRDVHLSWSTPVFKAGWVALRDYHPATPHYLEHAQKEYIDKRQGWHVGHSPVSRVAHRQSQELFV
jgi:hypothetical protein